MGSNRKRMRRTAEYVIDLSDHLDAKSFDFHYRSVIKQMQDDGVDLSYDDAFTVIATEEELIFRTSAEVSDD